MPLWDMLDLQRIDGDLFEARWADMRRERLFGGQVAAQSLRAAGLTVDGGRPVHSLHCYFIRPGRTSEPLRFDVRRTRDGRTFSTRHVTASQEGKPIFEAIASFHDPEPGVEWQPDPPAGMPPADGLAPLETPWLPPEVDIRPVRPPGDFPIGHPFWVRVPEPPGADAAVHACALTYLSDYGAVNAARPPDDATRYGMRLSLDHTLWFHRPPRVGGWLLYTMGPAGNGGGRGLAHGAFHTPDGTLVASVAQEALLRLPRD
ncbi:acyl-CoA thioesterase domain-containing protein [Spirillospora sp. NPDC047279]|uniref:acyl-CoA thioesterase n=1 Tax=Spirillospora sp. NPDC047279 TaxID=3155478 RepID=UPI0033F002EC